MITAENKNQKIKYSSADYDGIVDTTNGTYFVYSSNQIKSATDNIGTFDRSNNDIYAATDFDLTIVKDESKAGKAKIETGDSKKTTRELKIQDLVRNLEKDWHLAIYEGSVPYHPERISLKEALLQKQKGFFGDKDVKTEQNQWQKSEKCNFCCCFCFMEMILFNHEK